MVKHISCNCKCKISSTTCNSNQKWSSDKCQCGCKKYIKSKKYWNPNTCICEYSKYLKSIVGNSITVFSEIKRVTDSVSTYLANNMTVNGMRTASINSDDKKF